MPNLKTTLQIVGNYMCKNPPVILLDVTEQNSQRELIKRYMFNTPSDIQRHFQSQFVRIYGFETVMYTSFSHEVLAGMVNLVIALHDFQKFRNVLRLRFYGTQKHWDYFQTARFHLGEKVFGTSYSAWLKPALHRLGIIDQTLYDEIQKSENFSAFVMRINWRIQNEAKEKINDSREYLKDKNEFYEDDYVLIKPFFEKDPSMELKQYYGSSTHFFCVCKEQGNELFGKGTQSNQSGSSNDIVQKATLIVTYRSVEQMSKILDKTDGIKGVNNDVGLLDFIQWNLENHSPRSKTRLQTIVHIISSPQLALSTQFHRLFSTLDNLCYPSPTPCKHLFYGFGIKSSSTNIHHLLNSYYKGIRFYSICSKLFRFIPNITLNHLSYWSKVFDKEFVNVTGVLEEKDCKKNGSWMEVYKPVHKVVLVEGQDKDSKIGENSQKNENFYAVSAQLLAELKYPLFDTASDYRLTEQLRTIYQKKAGFQRLNLRMAKTKHNLLTAKGKLIKQFDPKVIFLGTNSKTPNQLRNVSGILLQIPHQSTESLILMDCGQGTYQQFVYHYSPEELQKKLLNLRVIFMTHLHGDHNLGVTDLIKKRNDLLKRKNLPLDENKLFLILPFNALSWFWGYCKEVQNLYEGCQVLLIQTLTGEKINLKDDFFESKRCQFNLQRLKLSPGKMFGNKKTPGQIPAYQSSDYYQRYIKRFGSFEEYIKASPQGESGALKQIINAHTYKQEFVKEMFDQLTTRMKVKKFKPSKVFHCPFSYGVVIEHNNGIKVSYSGDCRPTPQFLEDAKNSTLLIHEATYETNRKDKALLRLHSTFHQAIQAGITSNSDNVCVTHFTPAPFDRDIAEATHKQLYKPQVLDYYQKKTIIACDHLSFKLSDLEEVVKVSKVISHIGTNSVTQKDINPYTAKFLYLKTRKQGVKSEEDQENEENVH